MKKTEEEIIAELKEYMAMTDAEKVEADDKLLHEYLDDAELETSNFWNPDNIRPLTKEDEAAILYCENLHSEYHRLRREKLDKMN